MWSEAEASITKIILTLPLDEARELYAELYRLSADDLCRPYPADSMIGSLMRELAKHNADT